MGQVAEFSCEEMAAPIITASNQYWIEEGGRGGRTVVEEINLLLLGVRRSEGRGVGSSDDVVIGDVDDQRRLGDDASTDRSEEGDSLVESLGDERLVDGEEGHGEVSCVAG